MTPKQIRNQLARRILNDDRIDPRVLKAYGINPSVEAEGETELTYPPLPNPCADDEIYQGVVPFELQVGVSGHTHTFDCRAVYTATLTDDGSVMAICTDVLGRCNVAYQMLTWEPKNPLAHGRDSLPLPRWVQFEPGKLFPGELHLFIQTMIERDALRLQESEA